MGDLKPCPFCGESNARICTTSYLDTSAHAVACRTRECHGVIFSLGFGLFESEAEAIAAWNTRPPAQVIEPTEAMIEAMGQALFYLSDSIREHGCLADDIFMHRYDSVVEHWDALTKALQAAQPTGANSAVELRARIVAAIDDDLERQAEVQSGCDYWRTDECGVAAANMNIVTSELADAIARNLIRGDDGQ